MPFHRILILDDDADLVRLYAKVFRKSGYDVIPARTLETARAHLADNRYDVFVCDMQIDGGNSLALLREYWARLKADQTCVIVISGREEFEAACADLGVEMFLHKPISMYELTRYVERVLDRGA